MQSHISQNQGYVGHRPLQNSNVIMFIIMPFLRCRRGALRSASAGWKGTISVRIAGVSRPPMSVSRQLPAVSEDQESHPGKRSRDGTPATRFFRQFRSRITHTAVSLRSRFLLLTFYFLSPSFFGAPSFFPPSMAAPEPGAMYSATAALPTSLLRTSLKVSRIFSWILRA